MAKYTKKETVEVEPNTNAEASEEVKEEVKAETKTVSKKTNTKAEKAEKKEFKPNDMITCRSICQGGLYLEGPRTKMPYEWTDYGTVEEVEYRDLVELVRTKSNYLFSPHFIVDDVDFIEEFPALKKFYDDNYSVVELSQVLELPLNQMIAEIETLPQGARETLKSIAASQVSSGQLDSIVKVKALDRIFGTDLNLLSELIQ